MQEPLISIVIPCYNQGEYIQDALSSIKNQTYHNIEIVIVNDGSTDALTRKILEELSGSSIKVIHRENKGLSTARNTAIRNSSGKYILPLDADDMIAPDYISTAISILEGNSDIGVVYGRAEFFGEKHGDWHLEKFEVQKMLFSNLVYAAGIYRRKDFDLIGGYSSEMKFGWEDWDFWLSMIERKKEFYFIEKIVFYYRVRNTSMVNSMTEDQKIYSLKKIYCNHSILYDDLFSDPISLYYKYRYYKEKHNSLLNNKFIHLINSLNKFFFPRK